MKLNLSTREKWLAMAVGGIFLLLVAFIFVDRTWQEAARLRAEIATRTKQLQLMQNLAAGAGATERQEAWLRTAQPRLTNPDSAGVQLLNEVKETARRHGILLENPAIRPAENHADYVSVAVEVESKSPWKPLIDFQYEFQNPAQFIAVESVNLKIDSVDPTQMRGRFKIARWFTPR